MKRFFKKVAEVVTVVVAFVGGALLIVAPFIGAGMVTSAVAPAIIAAGVVPAVAWLLAVMLGIMAFSVMMKIVALVFTVSAAVLAL